MDSNTLKIIAMCVIGYLLGSIPSGVWIGKLMYGKDIRDYGSGNMGTTNTFRVLGKKAGITALCEYSLLSDNEYPTYAITKKEITESGIRKMKQVHSGEEIGCVVLELGYFIDFKNM